MKRLAILLALVTGTLGASESVTQHAGVATSSRYATQVAVTVLRNGGTAVDAATAAAFVLSVIRPDAAGIGGGGILLYYDKAEGATWSVDFRETAPWAPEEKTEDEGTRKPPERLAAAGTPGLVRGLSEAQQRFGKAKWKDLLQPAILLAQDGFESDQSFSTSMNTALELNALDTTAKAVLLGENMNAAGRVIRQPDLASTLTRIAKDPVDFYEGTTASKIVEFAAAAGGRLTIRDFREYRPVWRAPLRIALGTYSIQTAPPPSRGGVAIASMLSILGGYELDEADLDAPGTFHLLAEAQRRATFDSRRVVADPAYSRMALVSVLGQERAEFWRSTIEPDRATSTPAIVAAAATPSEHTTHISIVDPIGNVASLTISLGGNFGSGVMVPGTGILLNGALRDFTYSQSAHPNAPEPRKRPATPIAPMIAFFNGQPVLAAGSSGGDAIPACLTSLIIRLRQKDASLRDAIAAPRISQSDYPDALSFEPGLDKVAKKLSAMGHQVSSVSSIGEINAVMIRGERIISISDPRGKGSSGGF